MSKTRPLKLEQQILNDMGAVPHANSGAMKKKNDGSTDTHLIEIKTTQAQSFIVKKDYWEEVRGNALKRGLEPMMIIAFDDGGSVEDMIKVIVIDYDASLV